MDDVVSSKWLAAHLADSNLVILDATLPAVGVNPAPDVVAAYLACHVPGAVFFDIEALSDHSTRLPHMLPSTAQFAGSMAALGVSDNSQIVVYEQNSVFSAPRAWWMLRTLGAQRVSILDGGLQGWIDSGHPTEAGLEVREAAHFTAKVDEAALTNLAGIRSMISEHGQVVDARSPVRFNGTAPEPRPGLPSGHMPGAINLPFTELIHEGRLLAPDQLRVELKSRGIVLDRPIATTCGSGITAAVLYLALKLAGAQDVSLYDGSWAEYASQPDALIETRTPLARAEVEAAWN